MLNASAPYLFVPFNFSFGSINVISGEYRFKKKTKSFGNAGGREAYFIYKMIRYSD